MSSEWMKEELKIIYELYKSAPSEATRNHMKKELYEIFNKSSDLMADCKFFLSITRGENELMMDILFHQVERMQEEGSRFKL